MNLEPPELSDGMVAFIIIAGVAAAEIILFQWPRIAEYMGWT